LLLSPKHLGNEWSVSCVLRRVAAAGEGDPARFSKQHWAEQRDRQCRGLMQRGIFQTCHCAAAAFCHARAPIGRSRGGARTHPPHTKRAQQGPPVVSGPARSGARLGGQTARWVAGDSGGGPSPCNKRSPRFAGRLQTAITRCTLQGASAWGLLGGHSGRLHFGSRARLKTRSAAKPHTRAPLPVLRDPKSQILRQHSKKTRTRRPKKAQQCPNNPTEARSQCDLP